MFEYINLVNKRSKRIKLQFCTYRGLIISSPKKLNQKKLDNICNEHREWIQTQQAKHPLQAIEKQPHTLDLIALEHHYKLMFFVKDKNKVIELDNTLHIQGKDQEQQIKTLKKWIRKQAQKLFLIKMDEWRDKTQLAYSKLSVRSQKSRWGSCSSTGTISLNDQLMFMPASILDYIIVHELCHTIHHNHSSRYWALVAQHYPNYQQQERFLAEYAKKIPAWFRASLY